MKSRGGRKLGWVNERVYGRVAMRRYGRMDSESVYNI
jgi:hypothetical protein